MVQSAAPRLHAKLAELRKELAGSVKKGAVNERLGYSFVEAKTLGRDFVLKASEKGLTMLPISQEIVDIRETSSGKQTVMSVKTAWAITDVETDETIVVEAFGSGADQGDKGLPKAQTNSMKYAILLVLQAAGDDPEADPKTDDLESGGDAQQAAAGDDNKASDAQLRLIRARAKERGLSLDQLKAVVFSTTAKHSLKDLTKAEVDKVLSFIADVKPDVSVDTSPAATIGGEPESAAGGN